MAEKKTPLTYKLTTALPNGTVMGIFLGLIGYIAGAVSQATHGFLPEPSTMAGLAGAAGFVAPFARGFLTDLRE